LLDQPPKDMIVIGSGAIGCEFAYFYNTFGTNVHILELADNILPLEDDEISKELKKSFNKNGIKVSLSTKVLKLESLKTKVRVLVETNNVQSYLESEIALLAVGVIGNIEGIGLNNIGIKTSIGKIDINDYNQTSIPNIYAIGDVSGPPWLAHRASAQANITIRHILGLTAKPLDSSEIPSCTYCQPQVASLGLTELQAKKEGHDIKIGKASFQSSGKALAIGKPEGFVKLIFDSKYGELIGAHIIGIEATELIAELGIAKALESTVEDLAFNIHAHPTLSESIMEAALDALGTPVHH
jgi:dihydrolipoamide dehydrogenase